MMIIFEILGQTLFWIVMIVGIVIIPFGIPGTFIIVGNALIYGWFTNFVEITWKFVGLLFVISVLLEVLEFYLGAATAGKFGASKQGMFGAIIGGFFGAILGTTIMPVVGTLMGAFAGAFAGAATFEYIGSSDLQKSLQVGFGAFLGALGGKLTKITAAIAMVVLVAVQLY